MMKVEVGIRNWAVLYVLGSVLIFPPPFALCPSLVQLEGKVVLF